MAEVHIKRDFSMPAAIQFKNPGAMWPGAIPTKWNSTAWQYLSDGTGQGGGGHGNKIAIFDNWVDGISAQLDLWRTSDNYKNKRFADAIATWSGHNHVDSYIAFLKARVPGLTEDTIMNDEFWRSPNALKFLKAQAGHEAGRTIPAPDADWVEAQRRVMKGIVPTTNTVKKAATAGGSMLPTVPTLQHAAGLSFSTALLIGLGIAAAIFLLWKFWPRNAREELPAIVNPVAPVVATPVVAPVAAPASPTGSTGAAS